MKDLSLGLQRGMIEGNCDRSTTVLFKEILGAEAKTIPKFKLWRMRALLDSLRSGGFSTLSTSQKQTLLENFREWITSQRKDLLFRACAFFFEADSGENGAPSTLPRKMVQALLEFAHKEKADTIRDRILALLMRKESRAQELAEIDSLIFGLWSNDPLVRGKLIRFLFHHFDPRSVIESMVRYNAKTGKRLARHMLRQLSGLLDGETELRHKKEFLSEILRISNLDHGELDRVWSDYLNSLNRFELILVLNAVSAAPLWMEDLKTKEAQLSLNFRAPDCVSQARSEFRPRVKAIQH